MLDQTTKNVLNEHITRTLWKRAEHDSNAYKEGYNSALLDVQRLIESLPCEEEKEGRWTTSKKSPNKVFMCSECKGTVLLPVFAERCYYDHCPVCGKKMGYETDLKEFSDEDVRKGIQNDIDTISKYEALKEKFEPYLQPNFSYPDIVEVTWDEDKREFRVYYEETFCGCADTCFETFPANIFTMTPEEYKEVLHKKKQEEQRLRELEREQNERKLLESLKKKYESKEVKDIFREAEGILLNEEDK